jgi:hypothetical protein
MIPCSLGGATGPSCDAGSGRMTAGNDDEETVPTVAATAGPAPNNTEVPDATLENRRGDDANCEEMDCFGTDGDPEIRLVADGTSERAHSFALDCETEARGGTLEGETRIEFEVRLWESNSGKNKHTATETQRLPSPWRDDHDAVSNCSAGRAESPIKTRR